MEMEMQRPQKTRGGEEMAMSIELDERPVLAAEARALAERLDDPEFRAPYEEMAAAVEAGEVPDEVANAVGALAALALETGRARSVHGPAGVRALISVWKRTPQGQELADDVEELNRALTALRGLPIEAVRVSLAGPGAFSISIDTPEYEMRLTVDRVGIRLASLNVGGGGIGE
jgi:hypothetical protein